MRVAIFWVCMWMGIPSSEHAEFSDPLKREVYFRPVSLIPDKFSSIRCVDLLILLKIGNFIYVVRFPMRV